MHRAGRDATEEFRRFRPTHVSQRCRRRLAEWRRAVTLSLLVRFIVYDATCGPTTSRLHPWPIRRPAPDLIKSTTASLLAPRPARLDIPIATFAPASRPRNRRRSPTAPHGSDDPSARRPGESRCPQFACLSITQRAYIVRVCPSQIALASSSRSCVSYHYLRVLEPLPTRAIRPAIRSCRGGARVGWGAAVSPRARRHALVRRRSHRELPGGHLPTA